MAIEDMYNGDDLFQIRITFNPKDLKKSWVKNLSQAFTAEALRWAERRTGQTVGGPPTTVRVRREKSLPNGLCVYIEDGVDLVVYVFDEDLISEAGAHALQRMLTSRALTWSHRSEPGASRGLR
ncbi:hypothetical protein U9R90_25155 [Streptomyces sp. E11-3]|uniref:hypothetical protein n=1 Tax=Streptomyces sp. E11-3 TaxID=3110112 RepID=UPI00397FE04A